MNEDQIMEEIYQLALKSEKNDSDKKGDWHNYLSIIADNRETNKGVLSVLITLLLKKIISPTQDIRLHQAGMLNGFSARGLDAKFVTPFLNQNGFPYMKSGAGALTRSLEQAVPLSLQYPGKIKPVKVRNAFLNCIDMIESDGFDSKEALIFLFQCLIKYRDRDKNFHLIKPINMSIKDMVLKINEHFGSVTKRGGAYLPVLAIYAVYQELIKEVKKYKGCSLLELQPHNAPDSKTGFLGDIQVNDSNGEPFEAVEIKHNIDLTADLVEQCYEKIKTTKVKTFYLLSTKEEITDERISSIVLRIHKTHGCQVIVNGIQTTLKYYLRLLSEPSNFLSAYVDLVNKFCNYEIKDNWQNLFNKN